MDIQLKILQTLPSLLQHYSNELSGVLLVSTLEICVMLQASKTIAVSSTAAATLQQLVVSTFERVSIDDSQLPMYMHYFASFSANLSQGNSDSKPTVNVTVEDNTVTISHFANDALRVRWPLVFLDFGNFLVDMAQRFWMIYAVLSMVNHYDSCGSNPCRPHSPWNSSRAS